MEANTQAGDAPDADARREAVERWWSSPLSTFDRIEEVQEFAGDLAETVATIEVLLRDRAFAGKAPELVALRGEAETLRIRMDGLADVLEQLAEHERRKTRGLAPGGSPRLIR